MAKNPAWYRKYNKSGKRTKPWWKATPKRKSKGFRFFGIRF